MSELPRLTEWQLMRLRDCAGSNRTGMRDRGFPAAMAQLAALGLVDLGRDGGRVTFAGLRLLADPDIKQQLKQLGGCV